MTFWVYVLRCVDDKYYTGHTDDLERRIAQHRAGGFCDFTSKRRPVALMWSEYFPTRVEALEAERQIKPWLRAKKEALFRGDWASVSHFAKPPHERVSTSLDTNGTNTSFVSSPSTSLRINFGQVAEVETHISANT